MKSSFKFEGVCIELWAELSRVDLSLITIQVLGYGTKKGGEKHTNPV